MSIEIDFDEMVPATAGSAVALEGDRLAVASRARLSIWHGRTQLAAADAPSPAPGAPRFAGERVYWGPGFLDVESKSYNALRSAIPAPRPGAAGSAHVYAWSPRGDRLIGSFSTGDSRAPVRVTLFDGVSGETLATLSSPEVVLPPSSAWVGERAAVVGFPNPRAFDRSGTSVGVIALDGANVVSLDATRDERRLLAVDLNRTLAWIDAESWRVVDRLPGPWRCAALSPDGSLVAVLSLDGGLHLVALQNDRFRMLGDVVIDPGANALALDGGTIAVARAEEVRRGRLELPS